MSEPLFDLGDGAYILCAWWLHGRGKDFMAIVTRPSTDDDLHLDYRFRYYVDNKVFDSDDVKNAYSGTFPGKTEVEALAIVDEMVDTLVKENFLGTRLPWQVKKRRARVMVRGDSKAFYLAIKDLPFVHLAQPGHAQDYGRGKGPVS
jgi:hypothetical protein